MKTARAASKKHKMNAFIIEGHFSSFHLDFQEELEVELDAEVKILDGLILPKEKALSLSNRERFRHQQGQCQAIGDTLQYGLLYV